MSSYTIIRETHSELRRRIHGALQSAPDADLGLTSPETDITFSPPDDSLSGSPRLSLYLYHIELDSHLRNQHSLSVNGGGLRFPPMVLQLRYLVTPLGDEEEDNHLMLGRILQHFHDEPFLDSLNGVALDDSFGGASAEFRISMESFSMEQLAQIWSALNANYRLSVVYLVRVVAIDSGQGVRDARRVIEAHTAVGTIP